MTAGIPDPTQGRSKEEKLIEAAGEALYDAYVARPEGMGWDEMARVVLAAAGGPALLAELSGVRVELDQARADAETARRLIARLSTERDESREYHGECVCDCNPATTDGPQEHCPQHGRPYSWWVEGCTVLAAREAGLRDERDEARVERDRLQRENDELRNDIDAVRYGLIQRRIEAVEAALSALEQTAAEVTDGRAIIDARVVAATFRAVLASPADPPIDVSCGAFIEGPFPGDGLAAELRGLAERWLYDGDRDRPINDGYRALLDLADRLAVPVGPKEAADASTRADSSPANPGLSSVDIENESSVLAYWRGYREGYRSCQGDDENGEPGMRLEFFAPFFPVPAGQENPPGEGVLRSTQALTENPAGAPRLTPTGPVPAPPTTEE